MVVHVQTVAFQGIKAIPIDVQVQMSTGLPAFTIVGLADKAVGESRERVRAAIDSLGIVLPPKRITVNLAPADLQKEGSHYDLPIALGILASLKIIPKDIISAYIVLGELALDGTMTKVAGVLPAAMEAAACQKGIICPQACGTEAAWAGDLSIIAAPHLLALVNHIKGTQVISPPEARLVPPSSSTLDYSDIRGQTLSKRALEIAAAGGHNVLMSGPPGAGKSMLAARLPTILPPLEPEEALELTMIYSVAGLLQESSLISHRPFRDPHHSSSLPALVGGSSRARPGEVSLAHRGVLFLDELPEFQRATLEALRQPLEIGRMSIARANVHITYPARFQLVAAMNPCRCGYLGDAARSCNRAPNCGTDYQAKLSGPLLDRIDVRIEVPALKIQEIQTTAPSESSEAIKKRVTRARQIQIQRYQDLKLPASLRTNAEADGPVLKEVATPEEEGQTLLLQAAEKFQLSARGYFRILRVARTIADLEESSKIRRSHIAEALSYRGIMSSL